MSRILDPIIDSRLLRHLGGGVSGLWVLSFKRVFIEVFAKKRGGRVWKFLVFGFGVLGAQGL